MTFRDEAASQQLEELLRHAERAPSLPAVALEVLHKSQDQEANLEDLAKLIGRDPALAACLIRYANSGLYNPGDEVTSLRRACVLLGLKTVQLLALSFSLAAAVPRSGAGSFDYTRFWRRSSIRAVAARTIAQCARSLTPDEAFLTGLIREFGQVVLAECSPAKFNTVVQSSPQGMPLLSLQTQLLGFNHEDALLVLLRGWRFPSSILDTLRSASESFVQAELQDPIESTNAKVLSLASMLTDALTLKPSQGALVELENRAQRLLNLGPEALRRTLDALETGVQEMDQLLGLAPAAGPSISQRLKQLRNDSSQLAEDSLRRKRIGQVVLQELERSGIGEPEAHGQPALELYLKRSVQLRLEGATNFPLGLLYLDVASTSPDEPASGAYGKSLKAVVRRSDLWVYLGEGRYALIMNESSPMGLKRVAERMRGVLRDLHLANGLQPPSASFGGACMGPILAPEDGEELEHFASQLADQARSASSEACLVHPRQLRSQSAQRRAG